jgi:hypothetical protein
MENTQIENTTDVIEDINEETLLSLDETLELDQEQTEIAEGKCKKEGEDMEDEEESDEDEKEDEEMTEAKKMTEAEVSSDEEFTSYAKGILKAAHGDNYDEAKAMAAIEGILKKADGDYGSAIGMITSGLGEEEMEDEKEVEMKEAEETQKNLTVRIKVDPLDDVDPDDFADYVKARAKEGVKAANPAGAITLSGPFNKVRSAVIAHYDNAAEAEKYHPQIKKKDMKEEVQLEEGAFQDKLKKLNPSWDPKKAKGDFKNEYDPDDAEDAKDHADYLKSADKFLDDISSFKPGVKIGDWVEVYIKNSPVKSKIGVGKIVAEEVLKGHDYGYMGYKGPSKIPGWQIKIFVEDVNGDYEDKEPNDYVLYNNKAYMNIGSAFYIQHEENQKNTFRKLPKQNLKVVDIKEEVIEENTISIDTSDITRLVESETGLTEEFKEKATIIFEAAVKSKLKETEETLKESYAVALIEEVETIKEELVEKIDNYLTYAVESWVEDNKVAIEGGLRTQIAENFIQSLKTVFVENYIEVPESKQDLVAEMETSIAQLQTESSELENTVLALNEKVNSLTREKVISESTTDLADTQVEKLKSLLEDIECTSETSFRKKVATIKEFYLNGAAVEETETLVEENANESSYITTETVIENETIAEETVSPAMQKYLTALSRLNKANEATVPVR